MQKVILITGVSSGIGEATARVLAKAGHRVFGGARIPEKVRATHGVELLRLDVRDEASIQAAVAHVIHEAGRIDVLINNAGVSLVGPVEATRVDEAEALFDTNLFGVLRLVRAVLPSMRRNGSGLIVNLSSVLGFLPAPFMGLYAASKHALEGMSETLDHEVRGFGVRVVLVEPSFTKTKLDTSAKKTAEQISDYSSELNASTKAVQQQVEAAPEAEVVAQKIATILKGPHRLRQPADGRAKLLSVLRRFAPAKQVDKSLRGSFGLRIAAR
ncbi:oxidoreductase [Bradyrhizobium genosp. A]|uniref:oxidoreductase n=1 Tax=Bradyrhizobium genosp. A TaxID=83626 RepID=UPI003CF4C5B1